MKIIFGKVLTGKSSKVLEFINNYNHRHKNIVLLTNNLNFYREKLHNYENPYFTLLEVSNKDSLLQKMSQYSDISILIDALPLVDKSILEILNNYSKATHLDLWVTIQANANYESNKVRIIDYEELFKL